MHYSEGSELCSEFLVRMSMQCISFLLLCSHKIWYKGAEPCSCLRAIHSQVMSTYTAFMTTVVEIVKVLFLARMYIHVHFTHVLLPATQYGLQINIGWKYICLITCFPKFESSVILFDWKTYIILICFSQMVRKGDNMK